MIPAGEGFSVMWREGQEDNKVVIPWHEGSIFIPPNKWFHQHFNVGESRARYLAFHPPVQFAGYAEKVEDRTQGPDRVHGRGPVHPRRSSSRSSGSGA